MAIDVSTYRIVLLVSGSAIPIFFSLLRFVPFPATSVTKFNAWFIDPPLFGSRHKASVIGLFHVPTRGQAFFLFYLVAINVILSAVGFRSVQPNSWYPSASGSDGEIISYFTNRVGVLSFVNIAVRFGALSFPVWIFHAYCILTVTRERGANSEIYYSSFSSTRVAIMFCCGSPIGVMAHSYFYTVGWHGLPHFRLFSTPPSISTYTYTGILTPAKVSCPIGFGA